MKHVLIILLAVIAAGSCKKAVEKIQENAALSIMTKGQWVINEFTESTDDVTGDFAGYSFQFYENGTVIGLSGGAEKKGTWEANIAGRTITAHFPGGGLPVEKLNAVWTITDSSADEVKAKTTIDNIPKTLWLKKK
ncbi:MAG: hypothetical protein QM664_05290 [Flavihumibacter sp.]